MFIGISGIIGVGKTTFTKALAGHLGKNWSPVYEPVKTNPYLEDFYEDISRWTFNMQMFLLAKRFQQHQEVLWNPCHRKGGGVIQDRTIYEDTIFARMHRDDGLMDDRDWETYISHFHIMQGFLRYPDVIVYLQVNPVIAMGRIHARGREAEKGMELGYLEQLAEGYGEFAREMDRYTVVIPVDWNNYGDVGKVAQEIENRVDREQKFIRSLRRI